MKATIVLAVALGIATVVVSVRPPVAAAQEDEETEVLVQDARRAISKKDYVRAGTLLDKALAVNPRRIDLYVLRASVYGVRGDHDAAIALLEKAQKLAPDNENVSTSLGIQLVQGGKAARGVPMLEKIVKKVPKRFAAQVVLGHQYVKQAMWAEAVAAFELYFKYRPSEVAGEDHIHKVDMANAQLRSGDPKKARKTYEEVLAEKKDSEAARLGVAWSAAAIDCKQALPLFADLADLEEKYAAVSLVRGRCALLLGRLDEALAAAERYRKAEPDVGDGWALLGDVQTAKKNSTAAESAYEHAVEVEPKNKVYAFKLGRIERLLGKTAQAAERLRATGAPRDFEDDWTIEYGEALFTLGEAETLKTHIAPWSDAHADSATGRFLYGAALFQLGDVEAAVPHLQKANSAGEPRAKKPLIDSLNTMAVAKLRATPPNLDDARVLLEEADEVGDDVLTWRNLGAVLLAGNQVAAASKVLRKAVDKDKDDAVAQHLLARSYQASKSYDDARAAYARAIKSYGKDKRAIAAEVDLATSELAAGKGENAVDALEAALGMTSDADQKALLTKQLVDAARDAATDAMRSGHFGTAVRVLKDIEKRVSGEAATFVRCDLALAATGAGQRDAALEQLKKLEKAKATCPFVAPADELAVPILIAWNEGATLHKARKALQRLDKIRSKARGVAEPLAKMAARDIALRAAQEAYAGGNLKKAEQFLSDAKLYDKKSPELAHNLAVVQLANGKLDTAISELDRIKDDVPEAYINLGIAYDRKHDAEKALMYWKKAVSAGAHYGPLKDWIDQKQRFWGDAP
jgi:tetratricopeptide (TPR) repeat protein